MAEKFILRQKVIDFMHHFFPIVDKFPKFEKFTLQTQIKTSVYDLLRLAIKIQSGKERSANVLEFDTELEILKELIVFSNTKKYPYLSDKSRHSTMILLTEIGKIIGGLKKKYCNHKG